MFWSFLNQFMLIIWQVLLSQFYLHYSAAMGFGLKQRPSQKHIFAMVYISWLETALRRHNTFTSSVYCCDGRCCDAYVSIMNGMDLLWSFPFSQLFSIMLNLFPWSLNCFFLSLNCAISSFKHWKYIKISWACLSSRHANRSIKIYYTYYIIRCTLHNCVVWYMLTSSFLAVSSKAGFCCFCCKTCWTHLMNT